MEMINQAFLGPSSTNLIESITTTTTTTTTNNNHNGYNDELKSSSKNHDKLLNVLFNSIPIMLGVCDLYDISCTRSPYTSQDTKNYDFKFILANQCTYDSLEIFLKENVKNRIKNFGGHFSSKELGLPQYFSTLWIQNMLKSMRKKKRVKFIYPRYVDSGEIPTSEDFYSERIVWKKSTMYHIGESEEGHPRFYYTSEEVTKEEFKKEKIIKEFKNRLENLENRIEQRVDECIEIRFKYVLESIPQMVWVTDNNGKIEFVNRQWKDYLGIDHSGKYLSWNDISKPSKGVEINRLWQDSLKNMRRFETEMQLQSISGEYRWFLVRAEPYFEPMTCFEGESTKNFNINTIISNSANYVKWIGSCTDLNDQKTAQDRIESAEKSKAVFLQTMSHEMRTPLAGIMGMNSWLISSSQSLTSDQLDCCHTINMCAEALLVLINNILDLSKLEENKIILEETEFSPTKIVEDSVDIVSTQAEQKRLDIIYQVNYQNLPNVIGDFYRIRQVLTNLISNSVKFTPTNGQIIVGCEVVEDSKTSPKLPISRKRINTTDFNNNLNSNNNLNNNNNNNKVFNNNNTTTTTNKILNSSNHSIIMADQKKINLNGQYGKLKFWVIDNGIGIPEEGREKLFQTFSQYDASTTRKYGGSGLGLAISKRLTQLLGGDIWFESQKGKGSSFHFIVEVFFPDDAVHPFCETSVTSNLSDISLSYSPTARKQEINFNDNQSILVTSSPKIFLLIKNETLKDSLHQWILEWSTEIEIHHSMTSLLDIVTELKSRSQTIDILLLIEDSFWAQHFQDQLIIFQQLDKFRSDSTLNIKSFLLGFSNSNFANIPLLKKPVKYHQLKDCLYSNLLYFKAATTSIIDTMKESIQQIKNNNLFPSNGTNNNKQLTTTTTTTTTTRTTTSFNNNTSDIALTISPANKKCKLSNSTNNCNINTTTSQPNQQLQLIAQPQQQQQQPQQLDIVMSPGPTHGLIPTTTTTTTTTTTSTRARRNSVVNDTDIPLEMTGSRYPLKIMVAEDSQVNQKVASRFLTRLGYPKEDIVFVVNGKQVLNYLENNEMVDVILMDMQMPELDGCEATNRIRNNYPTTGPHIIGLTANAFNEDKDKCLLSGMCQYLAKPVKLEILAVELKRAWLTRSNVKKFI
eukprot:gene7595-9339_t